MRTLKAALYRDRKKAEFARQERERCAAVKPPVVKERTWTDRGAHITMRIHPDGVIFVSTTGFSRFADALLDKLQLREMFRIDWLKPWEPEGHGAVRLGELIRGSATGREVRFWS